MKNLIKNNIEVIIFWLIIGYYIPTIWYNYTHSLPNPDQIDNFNLFFEEYKEINTPSHGNERIIIRTNTYD